MTDNTSPNSVIDESANAPQDIFAQFRESYQSKEAEDMSLQEYLDLCKDDKMAYANSSERLLDAIGEPTYIDTAKVKGELGNIFQGRTIAKYPAFDDFFGAEETIEKIVNHLRGAAQGTEYEKQVLYLLGPVGGGKSSLGERIKELMEKHPIYVLRDKKTGQLSPVHETPLGLFQNREQRKVVSDSFGIPERQMKKAMLSPWATKRLKEANGDPNEAFDVVRVWPSESNGIAVSKVEPGDENNQDTTVLVGSININKMGEGLNDDDPDVYLYSGGLSVGNQGVMEFVEMFKAPLKVLNPMLEALQSRSYKGSNNMKGSIPFNGLVLAHSNESEWKKFAGNKDNEAILDRINVVKVPYTLRMSEEAKIYNKMLRDSTYSDYPMAPKTIEMLAKFSVMSRLSDAEGVAKWAPNIRAEVYDGKMPDGPASAVPTMKELKEFSPAEQGMSGAGVRFAFKALTETFNRNANDGELAADPMLLFKTLEERIDNDDTYSATDKEHYKNLIQSHLLPEYADFIVDEITTAFTNASEDKCQNMFERYVAMAEAWVDGEEYNDKGLTGEILSKDDLDAKLKEIEKPAGISNVKDFRNEVSRYVMKRKAKGEDVRWDSYKPVANIIRKNFNASQKEILPVIKFDSTQDDNKMVKQRDQFIENMKERGYTMPMIKRAVALYEMRP